MNFTNWDLGYQSAGSVVRVTLEGNSANVRLLDSSNYSAFKAGRNCRGIGGNFKVSPVTLRIPSAGYWHVVVDYGGYVGSGRAAVQVVSAAS